MDKNNPVKLTYASKSAYAQMIHNVPIVQMDWTVEKTREYFARNISEFESIRYLYVVDSKNKLVGVASLKDIYRHMPKKKIFDVCKKQPLIYAKPDTDQGRVVYLALKNNIKAVPVVDEDLTLLGVVPSDRIMAILYHEAHNSVLRFAGIGGRSVNFDSVMSTPIIVSFKHRIPWLLLGIFGGILSAQIIGQFEATLEQNLILAAFIPLIVYISDAVGTQMEAYIIREIALEEEFSFLPYFIKQLLTTSLIGGVCGLVLFGIVSITYQSPSLALILGSSLFIAVNSAIFTGMVVPYVLSKVKIDPASASGPIATIIQDILSVVIYFSVASLLL